MDTNFSSRENLVMQVHTCSEQGGVTVDGVTESRIEAWMIIPKQDGTKIFCPLNYFQNSCSLAEEWILDDNKQQIVLDGVSELKKLIISTFRAGHETVVSIPEDMSSRLLEYFEGDFSSSEGFDCHAFACFLVDISCIPEAPNFSFSGVEPNIGDVVCLSSEGDLPNSIKHWVICLGGDAYISKFGASTGKTDSHVAVMSMENMHSLYRTNNIHVAEPLVGNTRVRSCNQALKG